MTTYRVTSAAQLNQTLNQAGSGDRIVVASGNYGSLNLNKYNKAVTITSESDHNPATFKSIKISKSSHITLDSLEFSGSSSGTGVQVAQSQDITIENSEFFRFYKALTVNDSSSVTVTGNVISNPTEDAMAFSGLTNLLVAGNKVNGMSTGGGLHHDMIQIHGGGGSGPSSNVTIRDNVLVSGDASTQGIYIGNSNGGAYRNITIDDNTVVGGHHHGISVFRTDGLKITNNTVVQGNVGNSKGVNVPKINVDNGSTNVVVSNNTAHDVPGDKGGWSVTNNKIVAVGYKTSTSSQAGIDVTPSPGGTSGNDSSGSGSSGGTTGWNSGNADTFIFDGDAVRGWTNGRASEVDFDSGDTIEFTDYDTGTFRGWGKGIDIDRQGRDVSIDDEAGLAALIDRSSDIDAVVWKGNHTLTLRIHQDDGTHSLQITGLDDPMSLL